MKTIYVLIDFENVQPKGLALLNGNGLKVLVFVGANQSKIPLELAQQLQKLGPDVQYIQASGNGSNALDFHIAFTIGELSKTDPNACFHVISKDTGFDPLIQYAKKKGISIQRSKGVAEVPALKLSNVKTSPERVAAIVQNLALRGQSRPRTTKTLSSTINSLFQKGLSKSELSGLVVALEQAGHITIEGAKITYHIKSAL